ncbi:MAG: hypothetical protein QXU18_12675 [Thermoplasmatales archaeon]
MISCSATKRDLTDKPAIEVYNGPAYRILRKYSRTDLDILILSAKYGLISGDRKISIYEKKMTKKTAKQMRAQTTNKLVEILKSYTYNEIYINLGKTYRMAIDFDNPVFKDIDIHFDNGTIGVRLHNLKLWLIS